MTVFTMGASGSKSEWQPPEIDMTARPGASIGYHTVSARVDLRYETECCVPMFRVVLDCDALYALLGEQYGKGYHMLHFARAPGDYRLSRSAGSWQVYTKAFFRKNTDADAGSRYTDSTSWRLHVEKSWLQTYVQHATSQHHRVVHTNNLVDSITRNTQNGERLISAMVMGDRERPTSAEVRSSLNAFFAVDLFFEIPSTSAAERYKYNIALVPVSAVYRHTSFVSFPDIECNWMETFSGFLSQGWRLIDIYIDTPVMEQLHIQPKRRHTLCVPLTTDALWILEKPASRMNDSTPMYEGTIVEHEVKVKSASHGFGIESVSDWDSVVRDMGSRGWEVACTLESRSCEAPSRSTLQLKSLLFFQRPLE